MSKRKITMEAKMVHELDRLIGESIVHKIERSNEGKNRCLIDADELRNRLYKKHPKVPLLIDTKQVEEAGKQAVKYMIKNW